VLKRRNLILSLVFLFCLAASLNAFAHCFVEHDFAFISGSEIPASIFCADGKQSPFLRQSSLRGGQHAFTNMQKEVAKNSAALLQDEFASASFLKHCSLGSSSVPIYQLKTVYRI
jgi:hypothetical protein